VAGKFGIDPFDVGDDESTVIERLAEAAAPEIVDDLFSLGSPTLVESMLETIEDATRRIEHQDSGDAWARLTPINTSAGSTMPWTAGYEAARQARRELGINGEPVEFAGDLAIATTELDAPSHRLIGVVASRSPACAIRTGSRTKQRFALARAAGEFLMRNAAKRSLLTSMRTEHQARTRSFAAEFLAPASGIRDRLGARVGGWIDEETVEDLAEEYGVYGSVVAHQIENHKLGYVTE
jgi:hypothetical protein